MKLQRDTEDLLNPISDQLPIAVFHTGTAPSIQVEATMEVSNVYTSVNFAGPT